MKQHWLVINTLIDCIENGIDADMLRFATLQLRSERERLYDDNLPIDEISRLERALNRVKLLA